MITIVGLRLERLEGRFRKGLPLFVVVEDAPVLFYGIQFATIHKGFETDRTSWPKTLRRYLSWIPFVARWIQDQENKYTPPAVFHDYALDYMMIPKRDCDLLYKAALRSHAVSAIVAYILGSVVRLRRPARPHFDQA